MKKECNTTKEILNRIKSIKKQQEKLSIEKALLREKLQEVCYHSDVEHKSDYTPRNYYDISYWENYDVCKICKKQLSEKSVTKGSYG